MVSSATARRRLLSLSLATTLVASVGSVAPAAAAGPASSAAGPAPAATAAEPFRFNLYRDGDFVGQTNLVQCVGASMQMMLNMMRPKNDRSAEWQLELQNLARKYSPAFNGTMQPSGQVRQRRGASSRGWAFGLTKLGYGPYHRNAAVTLEEAISWAAVAMRRTGRPAGLLVWRGAHAWVLSGFEATGDPLRDPNARITHVFVQDPLYPRTSSVWGRSPQPNARLSLKQLAADFVPWRPGRSSPMSGKFVIVVPSSAPLVQPDAGYVAA